MAPGDDEVLLNDQSASGYCHPCVCFRDGTTKIDFVLNYWDDPSEPGYEKKKKLREGFLDGLREYSIELERAGPKISNKVIA